MGIVIREGTFTDILRNISKRGLEKVAAVEMDCTRCGHKRTRVRVYAHMRACTHVRARMHVREYKRVRALMRTRE